jgi:hypothetical protein
VLFVYAVEWDIIFFVVRVFFVECLARVRLFWSVVKLAMIVIGELAAVVWYEYANGGTAGACDVNSSFSIIVFHVMTYWNLQVEWE